MNQTGISRATLNNYIGQGILPRPRVDKGPPGGRTTPRIGYFPESALDTLVRVRGLKNKGFKMAEIVELVGNSEDADAPTSWNHSSAPVAKPKTAPATGFQLTVDHIESPAYLVNSRFEVEWANPAALNELFGDDIRLSDDITERKFFNMLLEAPTVVAAEGYENLLEFHLAIAKMRLSKSALVNLESFTGDFQETEKLIRIFDSIPAENGPPPSRTEFNMAPRGEAEDWYSVHVSFFREGIFFAYSKIQDAGDDLLTLLSRRDIVIRDLLKRRRPYLTDLAVLVADLQSSVKICAELPPEEYFQLINDVWGAMEPILRRYFATHGKHVGDGMVSYFLPQPDSNFLMNALSCAFEMRACMVEISRRWRHQKNWLNDLILNIGIHEGQEWFGTFQTPTHVEFTVLGDTINMAGRLSDLARDGAVWSTKSLVGKLSSKERQGLRYGIKRFDEHGGEIIVPETFARISNLVDMDNPRHEKFADIAALAVTEVFEIDKEREG